MLRRGLPTFRDEPMASRLKSRPFAVQLKAMDVHCTAHRLQLAVQEAMTTVHELRDVLGDALLS